MKDIVFWGMDLLNCGVLGYFLAKLLRGILPERFSFQDQGMTGKIVCLQFLLVRLFLSNSDMVRKLLYGEDMIMASSRNSVVPVMVSMCISLIFCLILYTGSRMALFSLIVNFYALTELVRFTLYSVSMWIIDQVFSFYIDVFLVKMQIEMSRYECLAVWTEALWNLAMITALLGMLFFCLRQYKQYLLPGDYPLQQSEAALLLVPGIIGLVLGTMIRCMMFYYRENEIHTIQKDYPEMNILIPCMSLLCILSIMISAKMLSRVAKEHEKRQRAEIYQERVKELEAHIQDMEGVYDGIRGMKHDMKNYIADIKALVCKTAADSDGNRKELEKYMDSMETAMESLTVGGKTGNPVTDVILGRYVKLAEKKQISFQNDFGYPKQLDIDAFDISILLNNALENAVEACEKIDIKERRISVFSYQRANMFFLTIENRFDGSINRQADGSMRTRKEGKQHGFGLKNMRSCAEKYYGKIDIKVDGCVFTLTIMLQGKNDKLL